MLDTRHRKALRDVLLRKRRSLLVVAGIAVGLWGVAAVATAYSILSPDLRRNFLDSAPPSLVVDCAPLVAADLAALADLPGVAAVESRPSVAGRIEMRPGLWLPIRFFAVADFERLRVARFSAAAGEWPPPRGTLLVERDGEALVAILARFGAGAAGGDAAALAADAVRLRLGAAPPAVVRISGTAFDPALAPSRMERMIYGYARRATVEGWLGERLDERLLVTVTVDPRDRAAVGAVGRRLVAELEARGVAVHGWSAPPYEHPHQFQMDAVIVLLAILAGLALLLAGLLVGHLVETLLATQVRVVGVMKAIGATRRQVMAPYLVTMAALGLLAAAVAVPLGIRGGVAAAATVAGFLNFAVLTPRPPASLVVALVALAAIFPVVAAISPLARAVRGTVRQALDRHGVESAVASPPGLVARLGARWPPLLALGVRNAFRRPRRLAATVLGLVVGCTAFLLAADLRASLLATADEVLRTRRHDVAVYLGAPLPDDDLARRIAGLPGVARVESWTATGGRLHGPGADPTRGGAALFAVPAGSVALSPRVLAGRWLDAAAPDGLVVSQRLLAEQPGLELGGRYELEVRGRRLPVRLAGVVKEFGPAAMYLDAAAVERVAGPLGAGDLLLVSLGARSGAAHRNLVRDLETLLAGESLDVKHILTSTMVAQIIRGHLDVLAVALALLALTMMAVSALGVASSLAVGVTERAREIGVLRALGCRPWALLGILATEALVVALLAWSAAVALTLLASRSAVAVFGEAVVGYPFDHRTSWGGAVAALAVVVALALAASWGAARRARRQPIREALDYE